MMSGSFRHKVIVALIGLFVMAVVVAIMFPIFSKAREKARSASVPDYLGVGGMKGGFSSGEEAKTRSLGYGDGSGMPGMAGPGMMPGMAPSEDKGNSTLAPWGAAYADSMPRMVISTAGLTLEVQDAEKVSQQITEVASDSKGFVTQSNISKDEERKRAIITIRVPAKNYSSALARISGFGKVLSKNEEGQDVTEEYVDLQSQLRNLRREETAFLKVLDRAGKISEILQVERELSRVRGEIERATGRIKFLENRVSLATITAELLEPEPAVSTSATWDVLADRQRCLERPDSGFPRHSDGGDLAGDVHTSLADRPGRGLRLEKVRPKSRSVTADA